MVDDPDDVEAVRAALDQGMRDAVDYAIGKLAPMAEALHLLGAVAPARKIVDDAEWLGWEPGTPHEPHAVILRSLDQRNEMERVSTLRDALRRVGQADLAERIVTVYNAASSVRNDIAHGISHLLPPDERDVLVIRRYDTRFEQKELRYTTAQLRLHAQRAEWVIHAVSYVQHLAQRIRVSKRDADGNWVDQAPNLPPLPG